MYTSQNEAKFYHWTNKSPVLYFQLCKWAPILLYLTHLNDGFCMNKDPCEEQTHLLVNKDAVRILRPE